MCACVRVYRVTGEETAQIWANCAVRHQFGPVHLFSSDLGAAFLTGMVVYVRLRALGRDDLRCGRVMRFLMSRALLKQQVRCCAASLLASSSTVGRSSR